MINPIKNNNYAYRNKINLNPSLNVSFTSTKKLVENQDGEILNWFDSVSVLNQPNVKKVDCFDLKTKEYLREVGYYNEISSKNKLSVSDSVMLKIYKQIGFKKPDDVRKIIDEIKTQLLLEGIEANEKELLIVFYKMTKYANFEEVTNLDNSLNKKGFKGISKLNPLFGYINSKEIIKTYNADKIAVILDDYFLNHTNKKKVELIKASKKAQFVLPVGWNVSAGVFDKGIESDEFKKNFIEIFKEAKRIQENSSVLLKIYSPETLFELSTDDALNAKVLDKAFDLGIEEDDVLIINNPVFENLTLEKIIANNLNSRHITKKQFETTLNVLCERLFKGTNLQIKAKKVLCEYYLNNLRVYSPETFNTKLVNIHDKILKLTGADKTPELEEKIIYVVPTNKDSCSTPKSDEYITNLYFKLNNITRAKVLSEAEWIKERKFLKEGYTYVMLDDYSGTGITMGSFFPPRNLNGAKMVYAPVLLCEQAQNYIEKRLIKNKKGIYLIKGDEENIPSANNYINSLPKDEQNILKKVLYMHTKPVDTREVSRIDEVIKQNERDEFLSYAHTFACVCLSHMSPDNNAYVNANLIIPYFAPSQEAVKNFSYASFYENCRESASKNMKKISIFKN